MNSRHVVLWTAILAALAVCGTVTAHAQYFGQNKVQYQDFDFKITHTPHFDIYYYPEEEAAIHDAARLAERWYARHSLVLRDTLHDIQPLILYNSFPNFEQTNVVQGIGLGTGGVTEPALRRITMPFAGPLQETDHVLGHELVHAFQYDITGHGLKGGSASPAAESLPLWFIEGMAEYLSLGPDDPNTALWMRDAVYRNKIPSFDDLTNPSYFPYRYGQALLAYIGGRWGDQRIGDLLRVAGRTGNMKAAIDTVFRLTADSLVRSWHAALHAHYDTLIHQTQQPGTYGPALITNARGGGELNISPVLSPDGTNVAFFSTRGQFSIDLYLADARTGEVKRNIYGTALDAHLQNLEFITSAGAWDRQSRRFVFSAVRNERPVLDILNVENGTIEQEIQVPTIGEIFSPAWSPDGRYIAFSGLANGFSDLFLYDLQADSVRRLTNDAYADLQPAWSPDGQRLVFSTDRFSTQLQDLKFGYYELAVMDIGSRKIEELPGFPNGKHINPQWSSDGSSIYFLSDRSGVTNIYKLHLPDRTIVQVTNLYGGVTGITGLSPALSVAQDTSRLVYSVYEDGKYNIYAIDSASVLEGLPLEQSTAAFSPAGLPPMQRVSPLVAELLKNAPFGLPSDTAKYTSSEYDASLRLVGIGQPSIGAGFDPFGTYIGGGLSLFWSDMLGNHNLATGLSIQSGNGATDISALLGYLNTTHRLYWGVILQQVPYIYGGIASGIGQINGQDAYIEQQILYRETDRDATVELLYPFSRATRVEFSAGFRNITFSNQVITQAASLRTGELLQNSTESLPSSPALNLGLASGGLVYDNSVMGATSPVLGRRFRLDASPMVGTLSLINLLTDVRQYVMPVRPFTLAGRILHYGRYGRSAEDSRLVPMYIGYPGLVRGFNNGLFSSNQYGYFQDSTLASDPLYGSKILVGNLELRFPLFGLFGIGPGYYGYLPIELAAFVDGGVAWTRSEKPRFLGGNREILSSAGGALRFNFFGFAVMEFDYVHPMNPSGNWLWEFNLNEGF
jgi:hypothetical protein